MKISIIGAAGCVGSSIAFNIVRQGLADELMVADIRRDWLEHHAIDFFDAAVAGKIDIRVSIGSIRSYMKGRYNRCSGCIKKEVVPVNV